MSTHLVLPDPHAKPNTDNTRADWIGRFILDLKPDVVINGGDMWDMESLSSYDRGKKSFHGRSYKKDIEAGLEFDERLWAPLRKAKKKKPFRVFLEGNHEYRVKRAIEYQEELDGTIGFHDFDLDRNYDLIVEYEGSTPGVAQIDDILYAHYFVSGVKGFPVSGVSPARTLLLKQHVSSTSFHLHLTDWAVDTRGDGKKIMGLFAGVGHERVEAFAGLSSRLWWNGVIVKHNVDKGVYDPEFVSFDRLRKLYGA